MTKDKPLPDPGTSRGRMYRFAREYDKKKRLDEDESYGSRTPGLPE